MTWAEQISRLRVAAAVGTLPRDLGEWVLAQLEAIAPAAARLEERDALLRGAVAGLSGSRWARARRLQRELLALGSRRTWPAEDGVNLFDSAHGNLTSAGAFDAALLGAGRALLRKATAVGGGYLSLQPRAWIIPTERESAAEVILANASRVTTTEKNTPAWISTLQLVAEPRLANTAAFLAADNSQIDTVELGLLAENFGGPTIEQIEDTRKDCTSWKVRHCFGVKALDWRGLVRMPISG